MSVKVTFTIPVENDDVGDRITDWLMDLSGHEIMHFVCLSSSGTSGRLHVQPEKLQGTIKLLTDMGATNIEHGQQEDCK